jgi:ubiquinone/menaquinone biosynthesis C-methylase UbiE
MISLIEQEKLLYKKHWDNGYKKSQCAVPFAKYLYEMIPAHFSIIEIGSGDGTTIDALKMYGRNITGTDIYSTRKDIIECSANSLPFENNHFDYVVSTDVMEHIPTELVDESIRETLRVAKVGVIHIIACFESARNGDLLHKTVKNIQWWKEKFIQFNSDNKKLIIIDRKTFMKE